MDSKTSPRRRVYSTSQIVEYNQNMKKTYTPSDPRSVEGKNPLRRAKVQELNGQTSPDYGAQWKTDYHVSAVSVILWHCQQIWVSTLETAVRFLCPLFLLSLSSSSISHSTYNLRKNDYEGNCSKRKTFIEIIRNMS